MAFNKITDTKILVELDEAQEWTGDLIKKMRELQHLSIEELSQSTKISKTYLKAIENEEFHKLPAPVYIRGFVTQLSKILKLPHETVAAHYMERYFKQQPPPTS